MLLCQDYLCKCTKYFQSSYFQGQSTCVKAKQSSDIAIGHEGSSSPCLWSDRLKLEPIPVLPLPFIFKKNKNSCNFVAGWLSGIY